jgi:hypothetical protein
MATQPGHLHRVFAFFDPFRSNELRLWLAMMAYNLGILWLRLVRPQRINNCSLTSLRQRSAQLAQNLDRLPRVLTLRGRVVKTGARLIKNARYYWLLFAESHLTRRLFGAMVGRIAALPVWN